MYPHLQLVIDAADPHTLAAWWATALGWDVEPQDADFIRSMVDQGHATEDDTTVHDGALVWKAGCAVRPPGATERHDPRILFQLVPEAKTVKNRLHLDLRTDPERTLADEVARFVSAGATELHQGRQGPSVWTTMADPEGNEFCLTA